MKPEVITVGNLVVDCIVRPAAPFPPPGQLTYVKQIAMRPGGNGANTAIALARLGQRVSVVGRVGHDAFGTYLRDAMQTAGADVSHVIADPTEPTAVTLAGIHPGGDRSFLHALGANARLSAADVPWPEAAAARIFHLASVFALPGLDGPAGAELLRQAKARGLTTVLDVCWDVSGRWMELLAAYLPHADYFLPNWDEATALTGETEWPRIARCLIEAGCGTALITLGADGCYLQRAGERDGHHLPAHPITAADTTGAGDAFGAGFMAALLRGYPPERAARFAQAVAAQAVRGGGPQAVTSFESVRRQIAPDEGSERRA